VTGLEIASNFTEQLSREKALKTITEKLTSNLNTNYQEIWEIVSPCLFSRSREDLLLDLAVLMPIFKTMGGNDAIVEIYLSISDVRRW
jgi:hypothetical protein